MKIGIMGGTFNPIHIGHLILAESAREELSLDTVLFMPSKRPPHKENDTIISEDLRCAMTQAAIKGNHAFFLSDIEIKRMKTTYTVDTLRQLEGEGEIYFIMGADSLADMEKWYMFEEIFKRATIVVGVRKDLYNDELDELKAYFEEKYKARIHILSMPNIEVSATDIRQRFVNGKSIKYFVPDEAISILESNKKDVIRCWKDV